MSMIDMTAVTLDPRITFTCSSEHAFWSAAGRIEFAAQNVYPLEYDPLTLEPIGRHESEPSATNYALNLQENWTPSGYALTFSEYLPGALLVTISLADSPNALSFRHTMPLVAGQNYIASFIADYSNDAGGVRPYGSSFQSFVAASDYVSNNRNRHGAEYSSYVSDPIPFNGTGSNRGVTVVPIRKADSLNAVTALKIAFIQVERGSISTSPIITSDTATTRAASSVVIDTSTADGITVYYSDGSTDDYDTPDNSFSLPHASKNWASRYISKIEYRGSTMPITSYQTATAGSISDLINVVKSHIAASRFPLGSLVGVLATVGHKTQYEQTVGAGGTAVTDYAIALSSDRAEFTVQANNLITAGFQPQGDISLIQLTPGRTIEFAQAFVKA